MNGLLDRENGQNAGQVRPFGAHGMLVAVPASMVLWALILLVVIVARWI